MQNPTGGLQQRIPLERESQLQACGQLLQLMDLALQNWGTFGIRLQVLNAAVNAHKL